jgi:hypothetical protein
MRRLGHGRIPHRRQLQLGTLGLRGTRAGSGVKLETISTAFQPTGLSHFAPGDPTRLFVVEKNGLIRILENGAILAAPFLDLTAVTTKGSEQGLLGLAFAPDYETSGRFYVNYTTPGSTPGGQSEDREISCLLRSQPGRCGERHHDPPSRSTLYQSQRGMTVFGPDGFSTWDSETAGAPAIPRGTARAGMICSAHCCDSM